MTPFICDNNKANQTIISKAMVDYVCQGKSLFFRSAESLFTHYFIRFNSIGYIILRSHQKRLIFTPFHTNLSGSIGVKYIRNRVRIHNFIQIYFRVPFFLGHPILAMNLKPHSYNHQ